MLMRILIDALNDGDHDDDDDDDEDDDNSGVVSYNLRSIISHLKPTTFITTF